MVSLGFLSLATQPSVFRADLSLCVPALLRVCLFQWYIRVISNSDTSPVYIAYQAPILFLTFRHFRARFLAAAVFVFAAVLFETAASTCFSCGATLVVPEDLRFAKHSLQYTGLLPLG
jgi:hypothetical protein